MPHPLMTTSRCVHAACYGFCFVKFFRFVGRKLINPTSTRIVIERSWRRYWRTRKPLRSRTQRDGRDGKGDARCLIPSVVFLAGKDTMPKKASYCYRKSCNSGSASFTASTDMLSHRSDNNTSRILSYCGLPSPEAISHPGPAGKPSIPPPGLYLTRISLNISGLSYMSQFKVPSGSLPSANRSSLIILIMLAKPGAEADAPLTGLVVLRITTG